MPIAGNDSGGGYVPPPKTSTKRPTYSLTDPNALFKAKDKKDAIRRGLISGKSTTTTRGTKSGNKVASRGTVPGRNRGGKGSSGRSTGPVKRGSSSSSAKGGSSTKGASTSGKSSSTSKSTTDYGKIAKDAVSAELDPKLKAIKNAQKLYNQQQSRLQQENQKRGKQVSADLEFLYGKLDEQLAAQQGQTAAAYGSATAAVDQNYANLIASLTSNTAQSVDQVNAEAARLGLAAPVESQAGADGNFATMLAQNNRQNAALMLSAQAGNAAQTGNFIRDAEKGLGVQTNADFTASNTKELNNLINQQLVQDTEYDNQLTNLEMQRSTMEKQYMQQLEQQAYDRAQEAQQQAFMNQMAIGKFNLSQDKFSADQAYRKAQLELEAIKIQQAAQKVTGSSSSDTGTIDPGGATDYIKQTIMDPNVEAGLLQAWNNARYSGTVDFNSKKNRAQVIESMRQWLVQNRPELAANNEYIAYLSNAYDVYTGVKYAG